MPGGSQRPSREGRIRGGDAVAAEAAKLGSPGQLKAFVTTGLRERWSATDLHLTLSWLRLRLEHGKARALEFSAFLRHHSCRDRANRTAVTLIPQGRLGSPIDAGTPAPSVTATKPANPTPY